MLLAPTYHSLSIPKMPGMGKMRSEEWKGTEGSLHPALAPATLLALASLERQPIGVLGSQRLWHQGTVQGGNSPGPV